MLKTYIFSQLNCSAFCDSQNRSLVFIQPHFSPPFCQRRRIYDKCVGSVVAVVRGPDLGNKTPTGHPEKPRQSSLTVLLLCLSHRHNGFASMEPHFSVQVCSFIHASPCKTTCYDSPTLYFLPPPT